MKLWVDDLREPPADDWSWAKTPYQAIRYLDIDDVDELSLDHDLGFEGDTRPVVLWMAEHDEWPKVVRVHSQNPVGRSWLVGMIQQYAPAGTYHR